MRGETVGNSGSANVAKNDSSTRVADQMFDASTGRTLAEDVQRVTKWTAARDDKAGPVQLKVTLRL